MTAQRMELEESLTDLYFKFFTKFLILDREISLEYHQDTLVLLGGIFRMHSQQLTKFEKDLNSIIQHFYQ